MRWLFKKPLNKFRGWVGEQKTNLNIWFGLDSSVYRKFNDIILPTTNGSIQIDHLLVSPYGIFIIETKNRTGWIFGSEEQASWTQTLFNEKHSFQNPIRQTFRQKKGLSQYLNIDESIIHTVVYFVGDCEFKTDMPHNVINSGLSFYVQQYSAHLLDLDEVNRIEEQLSRHVSESTLTKKDHINSLRERHSSKTICPNCGSRLVVRTAKRGPNTGSRFLGCEKYPKCKYTKNI